ncbi:ABC transporter permease [Thioalkalivibrio thiocyanodenitrificans]|uniref:ABC transporter permease n=1 Tax=Thioalkalivibrio thiocyanodenitrificans TaxID=243063 RepID=UPI000374E049|nr:MlaE family lipid ABC transporter permease subunit [Thioalkalivibrio thiocyanodenitrificans]
MTLRLGGRLDAHTVSDIWNEALNGLGAHAGRPVCIDTGAVEYCDGAGVALLMDLLRQPRLPEAGVSLGETPEAVQRMLAPFQAGDFADRLEASRPVRPGLRRLLANGLYELGLHLYQQVTFIGEATTALFHAARHPRQVRWRDALDIAQEAGANALPIVMLIAFLMGVILAYQSAVAMRQFGAEIFVANLVALSLFRELGPLMTAIILAGRSGAAFAAEIGTMKVNEEINALTTMGLDPVRFLVVTRVLAAVAVMPLLTIVADLVGLVGGAVVMLTFDIPLVTYFNQVTSAVSLGDFLGGLFKATVFGLLVAGVGCLRGLETRSGAAAVGISTTRAVVSAIILIVMADGLFAVMYFHLGI